MLHKVYIKKLNNSSPSSMTNIPTLLTPILIKEESASTALLLSAEIKTTVNINPEKKEEPRKSTKLKISKFKSLQSSFDDEENNPVVRYSLPNLSKNQISNLNNNSIRLSFHRNFKDLFYYKETTDKGFVTENFKEDQYDIGYRDYRSPFQKQMVDYNQSMPKVYLNQEFRSLKNLLYLYFLDKAQEKQNILLNFDEIAIFSAIFTKKFGQQLRVSNFYTIDEALSSCKYIFKKRTEDCYKLVFKQAFKHLQNQFELENSNLLTDYSKMARKLAFYKFYFSSTAEMYKIPLESFYLPLTIDSKISEMPPSTEKTINSEYISLVTKSTFFIEKFIGYLKEGFITDYNALASKRIDKMTKAWTLLYVKSFCQYKAIDAICDMIVNNKKNKLPWFIREVEQAVCIVIYNISRTAENCV